METSREEKYDMVNKCQTLEELALIIITFGDEDGMIMGRSRAFNAVQMAERCRNFSWLQINVLTREFGIRQQAMHILYYSQGFPVVSKSTHG